MSVDGSREAVGLRDPSLVAGACGAIFAVGVVSLLGASHVIVYGTMAIACLLLACISSTFALLALLMVTCVNGVVVELSGAAFRPEILSVPLALLAGGMRRAGGQAPLRISVVSLALVFLALAFFSSVLSPPEPIRSIWIWVQLAIAFGTFLALSALLTRDATLQAIRVGSVVMSLISIFGLIALAMHYFMAADFGGFWVSLDGRAKGLSFEPNIYAAQCVAWLAILFAARNRLPRWILWVSAPIALGAIFAGTRAAWIALAILVVYALARSMRRPSIVLWTLMASAILIALSGMMGQLLDTQVDANSRPLLWRLAHPFATDSGTGAYRLDIYAIAEADMAASGRWLFGSGLNSFSQFHPLDPSRTTEAYLSSIWYQLVYDVGIIGLLLFAALCVAIARSMSSKPDTLVVLVVLVICASTTNVVWLSFTWVYIALAHRLATSSEDLHTQSLGDTP